MTTDTRLSAAARMMRLFAGFEGAHGRHGSTTQSDTKGGKQEIKKTARTVREPVTEELWERHLRGEQPLGIIPIREDQHCLWGCIDVDQYDLSHVEIVTRLEKLKLPLVVCRSKSGGAHIFLFLSRRTPADRLRSVLRQLAASLGWGDCEIFPKQSQVMGEQGDLGNWLNMPYLGGDTTDRYAVKSSMGGMTLAEFLDYAEARRTTLERVRVPSEETVDESLADGPPCLEHLSVMGFPEGSRNNGLFSLGVFCKKKFGDRWREMLEAYNRQFMQPPLPSEEVLSVIKSLEKKEYGYKCKEAPCVSHCNSVLCRTRRHGVSGGGLYPEISSMSKLETEPPIWFLDIEDHRIQLSTRELLNYREFQAACVDRLTIMFMNMKSETWTTLIGDLMRDCQTIEAPLEASTDGHFMDLLQEFCTNRHRGETVEDLLLGKPALMDDRYYFRLKDLMDHLERSKFRDWGRNNVARRIIDLEKSDMGGRQFFNFRGAGVNTLWVSVELFESQPDVELPESRSDPI